MRHITDIVEDQLEERAKAFATKWHGEQKRKYTGEPYVNHPEAVAAIVRSVPHTPTMLIAAWLHDVLEDTAATQKDIHDEFGMDVLEMVIMLTDVSKPADGNRAARKALDRLHISRASDDAKTVKLADLIDNSSTITQHDPDFANV